jgi:FKBP-type peptidyl-prolyl cis-trans isomerase 2
MLAGLALGLQNLKKGEKRKICLSAVEAYGLYDPKKVILYPRKKIPKTIAVGENISIAGKSGAIRTYRIVSIHDDMVSLDGNHALAGQDLIFEIETLEARDATAEEIAESIVVPEPGFH